jgi:hypothetical protein
VPHSARQFDSVLKQLRILAEVLALRARSQRDVKARGNADTLGRIASALAQRVSAPVTAAVAAGARRSFADQARPPTAGAPAAEYTRPRPAPVRKSRRGKKP